MLTGIYYVHNSLWSFHRSTSTGWIWYNLSASDPANDKTSVYKSTKCAQKFGISSSPLNTRWLKGLGLSLFPSLLCQRMVARFTYIKAKEENKWKYSLRNYMFNINIHIHNKKQQQNSQKHHIQILQ